MIIFELREREEWKLEVGSKSDRMKKCGFGEWESINSFKYLN